MNRNLLFFFLYFFEGAPIGLIWWAIPTLMSKEGVDIANITALTAAAALPWTFKFLLGPLVDRYFGTKRAFALGVAFFQLAMLAGLIGLLIVPLTSSLLFWVVLFISIFSASQDVIIDAWAIGFVKDQNRGSVNGSMQAGMITGRWLFGAGLLMALATLNWEFAIGFLSVFLFCSIAFLVFRYGRDPHRLPVQVRTLNFSCLSFVFSKKFLWLGGIALLTGFAFESVGGVVGPFLIENGFSKESVGGVLSITLVAMLLGALFGGKLSDKKGSKNIFLLSGIALSSAILILSLLGFAGTSAFWLVATIILIYFFIGKFTASSYAFFMKNAQGEMEATQFTFLMAMTNLCESSSAYVTGQVASRFPHGYPTAFFIAAIVSLLGLLLLWRYQSDISAGLAQLNSAERITG